MNRIKIIVEVSNEKYTFDSGAQAYIFDTGILNDMLIKYDIEALLKYVGLVYDSYLKDDNRTPLGALCDYVAENWEWAEECSPTKILECFYLEC